MVTENIRNILLIGRTGVGKSTLANVITGTDKFKEGGFAESETRNFHSSEFEYKGIKYRVVDTVGIDDTEFSQEEVLKNLSEACWHIKEELNQVLFVSEGRFTEAEKKAYELLSKVIFNKDVSDFITIVRTKFDHFNKDSFFNKDADIVRKKIENLIIFKEIIHVNNPTLEIYENDEKTKKDLKKINEDKRKSSRNKILERLENCDKVYKSENLYRKRYEQWNNSLNEGKEFLEKINKLKEELDNSIKLGTFFNKLDWTAQTAMSNLWSFIPDNVKENLIDIIKDSINNGLSSQSISSGLNIATIFITPQITSACFSYVKKWQKENEKEYFEKIEEIFNEFIKYKEREENMDFFSNLVFRDFDYSISSEKIQNYINKRIKKIEMGLKKMELEKNNYEKTLNEWENRWQELKNHIEIPPKA